MILKHIIVLLACSIFFMAPAAAQGGWEKNSAGRWVYVMRTSPPVTPTVTKTTPKTEPVKKVTPTKTEPSVSQPAPIQFDETKEAVDGRREVRKGTKWGIIDQFGVLIVPPLYDDFKLSSMFIFGALKNGKWGFIRSDGEVLIDFEYDNLLEGFAGGNHPIVVKDGMKFRINDKGAVVSEKTAYTLGDISLTSNKAYIESRYKIKEFKNGFAIIEDFNRYGFVDSDYKIIVAPIYKSVRDFYSGVAVVNNDQYKSGLINRTGKLVAPMIYDYIDGFLFRDNRLTVEQFKMHGFIDTSGALIIPMIYKCAGSFFNGSASVCLGGKYGLIDTAGNVLLPFIYESPITNHGGISTMLRNGKWGYINMQGKDMCTFIYEDVDTAKFGRGKGLLNGKWIDVKLYEQ